MNISDRGMWLTKNKTTGFRRASAAFLLYTVIDSDDVYATGIML